MLPYSAALVLIFFFQAGSSQSVMNGFIGDEVLLPCIYPGQLPDSISAFWRDRKDRVVLDIISGTPTKMDPKFKGRVFSYPDQYKMGNLSILIKDLRADDNGTYDCYIPKVDHESRLTLRLTETTTVTVTSSRPPPTPAEGSSQSVRNGFIGDEVLLPCIYPGQLPDSISAFWRDRKDRVVLDIINGRENKTDPKFKGRVFSYPEQYKKGNLSILIKDLRADDAGMYECFIPRVDYDSRLTLRLTEKPAVLVTSPRPPPTPAPHDAAVPSSLHPALLSAPVRQR